MMKFVIAPGWIKSVPEVKRFSNSGANEMVLGSFTPEPREGNIDGRNFHHSDDHSIVLNSIGLKNPSLPVILTQVKEVQEVLEQRSMDWRLSVAAFSVDGYLQATEQMIKAKISRWEYNWGCPNGLKADKTHERIMSFDLEGMEDVLNGVERLISTVRETTRPWIAVKLSPYSDPFVLKDVALLLNDYKDVDEVVASNTFPNAMAYTSDGKPFIEVAGGFAGYSGKGMKPITLGQVAQLKKHLHGDIVVAAANGVESGIDVRDYELAGASSVHIGSVAFTRGPGAVSRIMQEYADLKA